MRRLLLITLATALVVGLAGPASSAAPTVYIYEPGPETPVGFTPALMDVGQGQRVIWQWMEGTHRVRDAVAGLGFINSYNPPDSPGATHEEFFAAAGTYRYICTVHDGMFGRVRAPVQGSPVDGGFVIRWSTATAMPGYVFDVQARETGTVSWLMWKSGVTRPSARYAHAGSESFQFRARVRRIDVGTTGWSRAFTISEASAG